MMKPSEFQTTIENQFDYICKVAMEDERKDYLKALSRQCKRETLFCDMDDYTVSESCSVCFKENNRRLLSYGKHKESCP